MVSDGSVVWQGERGGRGICFEVAMPRLPGTSQWFWVRRLVGSLRVVAGHMWVGVTKHRA